MLGRKRSSLRVRLWRRWIPELDLLPPHAWNGALQRAGVGNNWQTNLLVSAIILLCLFGVDYVRSFLHSTFPLPPWAVWSITALMLAGLLTWGLWLTRGRIRRRLRELLILEGFPICGPCGYDLRGLTEPRCPECGTPFDEKLLRKHDSCSARP